MRARLCALLVVGLLLAPLPALAAPDRSPREEGAGLAEGLWLHFVESISTLFDASEDDKGPGVDPNGLTPPLPPPPSGGFAAPEAGAVARSRTAGSAG